MVFWRAIWFVKFVTIFFFLFIRKVYGCNGCVSVMLAVAAASEVFSKLVSFMIAEWLLLWLVTFNVYGLNQK